ncbi:MAG: hypothetical protein Greene041679_473 [Parcubacteria group bacterium Greene0416_79]|nr:MAG: hypothetical protein Greene041679_473 [Parcubacteria group bacterium Greene0416_79]
MSKTAWAILIAVIAGFLGWGGYALVKKNEPSGPDLSVFYPAQNREHIAVDATHGEYNSNPPSGGWHYALTARKKFYNESVPDGYVIHNLEHGDVWIAYHPRIPAVVKNELKKFAFAKMIITPREQNDTDIALVSWERVDKFNLEGGLLPEGRIRDFIKRYRNRGPEKIPAGAMESTFN